ncbi:serpentine type 7TM GPCR chemoreceptor srv domain-containing protein [Ditylenchus destructor]|nr:serpentine type 7TM GPCR chemoreceptor srv domain-containing protein [Ditylenchus destructor]
MLDTFIILSLIDPPLIMLNISMIYFLYKQRPRDAKLRNGFFALFLVISVADCVGLICMIIFNQLINMGIMVDWFLSCSFCAKIHQEIDDYCRYLQLVGHAMIAFNRFRTPAAYAAAHAPNPGFFRIAGGHNSRQNRSLSGRPVPIASSHREEAIGVSHARIRAPTGKILLVGERHHAT